MYLVLVWPGPLGRPLLPNMHAQAGPVILRAARLLAHRETPPLHLKSRALGGQLASDRHHDLLYTQMTPAVVHERASDSHEMATTCYALGLDTDNAC